MPHRDLTRTSTTTFARRTPDRPQTRPRTRPGDVPGQRGADEPSPGSVAGRAPQVTVFHDGIHWAYRLEGEHDLGHRFDALGPAVAGARYLARSRGALLVVEDGTSSRVDYSGTCDCHARDVRPRG